MAVKDKVAKTEKTTTPVKFTKEELDKLTNLQQESQNVTFRLGQLYLNKIRLEEQENSLKTYTKNLEEEEAKLARELSDKYGKGSINIETGEFTPIKQ